MDRGRHRAFQQVHEIAVAQERGHVTRRVPLSGPEIRHICNSYRDAGHGVGGGVMGSQRLPECLGYPIQIPRPGGHRFQQLEVQGIAFDRLGAAREDNALASGQSSRLKNVIGPQNVVGEQGLKEIRGRRGVTGQMEHSIYALAGIQTSREFPDIQKQWFCFCGG